MALSGTLLKRLPMSTSMLYLLAGLRMGPSFCAAEPVSDHRPSCPRSDRRSGSAGFAVCRRFEVDSSTVGPALARRAAARNAIDGDHDYAADSHRYAVVRSSARCGDLARSHPGTNRSSARIRRAAGGPDDRDSVRFSLTGEGGLNDGAAFPFVMLGSGLIGLRDPGAGYWRWVTLDLIWPIAGGLAIGALCGYAIGKLVLTCVLGIKRPWGSTSS